MWEPFGQGAARRVTVPGCHQVLVLVPHVVAGTRLMDVLTLLEADHRLQVVCAVPPEAPPGTEEFVLAQGSLLIPWAHTVRHRFDLVLAASRQEVDRVHGPVLVLPHGAGAAKSRRLNGHGLDRASLTRAGQVVPAVIVLAHDDELALLADACPEAVPHAVVAGDLCLDRMRASLPFRDRYRAAAGIGEDETLVTVSSTWSPSSTFGSRPELYRKLLAEHRVAAVLHPNIWQVHGAWQVRAWLADCAGLVVVPPEEGWRAVVVASDVVVGDHGSVTQYAAAVGVPVALASTPPVRPGSYADVLSRGAPLLDPDLPVVPQAERVPLEISSRPGESAAILRRAMYGVLGLSEPARACHAEPVPVHHV
ncbi:hypothetical protein SAMN04488564_111299 [Lentzea waywayandensis]|uniref:CDP-Glycerol:Poly(Glycerophosphate) glycerophosphotransferase n=1 Tax=Lentzea waywayandensis TaxID=84724 RepID=A0A1I6FD67_9PSEU|nr:hypothetical protein [Lentzea waywayandensis]SFR27858.1 hypothetical protein SAMN04488564_111299 [Lentzea waywayandensis]